MTFEQDNLKLAELFEFVKNEDGYELKRYLRPDDSAVTEIAIPPKFRYVNVVSVAANAFKDAFFLKTVRMPETVLRVGDNAFEYCSALENITLSPRIKIIPIGMFDSCRSLKRVELPESVGVIRSQAFFHCSELEEVVMPKNGCLIRYRAFDDCPELRRVILQEGAEYLFSRNRLFAFYAFLDCPKLPAEMLLYSLIGTNDLTRPFKFDEYLDWDTALRRDVFELALQHDSFREIDKRDLFRSIIDRNLIELLPLASGMLDEALTETLADYSAERGKTEITAWLLNHRSGGKEKTAAEKIDEEFDL